MKCYPREGDAETVSVQLFPNSSQINIFFFVGIGRDSFAFMRRTFQNPLYIKFGVTDDLSLKGKINMDVFI